jgi:hypothetical protein
MMNLELQIGLGLALIGALLGAWHWIRRAGMTRAKGSIVRIDIMTEAKGAKSPARAVKLTVRFTDGQGAVRFFTGLARGEDRKPGDTIGILYRASDPQKAMIDDLGIWVAPIVVVLIGIGLAVMGWLKQG